MKSEHDKEIQLDSTEKKDLAIQVCLEFIPSIGGALSTAYYGYKQEIRFKRLETFYEQYSDKLLKSKVQLTSIKEHDKNALMALIEELNETVEREIIELKKKFLHNYFHNILASPTKINNYEERRAFLNALTDMTYFECTLISNIKKEGKTKIEDLDIASRTDTFVLYAAINKLESFGFLKANQSNYVNINSGKDGDFMDERSLKVIEVSPLGERFIQFCIKENTL